MNNQKRVCGFNKYGLAILHLLGVIGLLYVLLSNVGVMGLTRVEYTYEMPYENLLIFVLLVVNIVGFITSVRRRV